jgi:hypothetical protein
LRLVGAAALLQAARVEPEKAAMRRVVAMILAALLATDARAEDIPIFDAHLHYNAEAQEPYPLPQVLELFRRNGVRGILANSRPNDGSWRLHDARSEALWVVPFMRPYRTRADIPTWFRDPEVLALLEFELQRARYFGIGEVHLHGQDARDAGVKRVVDVAVARDLWLHAHTDADGVAALYAHNPRARVIWAHTGFSTPPQEVDRLLRQHPGLMAELSYRSGIVENGQLTAAWRALLVEHADRFLLGSDTWVNERWAGYSDLIAGYRVWLAQLPSAIARQIAFGNAERMFGAR